MAATVDPLAGSYYVETLTETIHAGAMAELAHIDALGGTLVALEAGYQPDAIGDAAYEVQRAVEAGERIIVGVNAFTDEGDEQRPAPQVIDPELERQQVERTRAVRARRDQSTADTALAALTAAAEGIGERPAPHPRRRRGRRHPRRDRQRPARRVGRAPPVSIGPIHHVAIVVRSIEEALPRYRELFGLEPEAPPMTFAPQRVRLCFLPTGPEPSARLELVEPIDDDSGVAPLPRRPRRGRPPRLLRDR